eukprot:scaffold90039_cov69-Phaeocystis_antarctica.AAC.1
MCRSSRRVGGWRRRRSWNRRRRRRQPNLSLSPHEREAPLIGIGDGQVSVAPEVACTECIERCPVVYGCDRLDLQRMLTTSSKELSHGLFGIP